MPLTQFSHRSHRYYGSQDTMDRNSVGSPLASPFGYVPSPPPRSGDVGSPFGYVPSPPPRGTSMDAARVSLSSAELFDGLTSPGIENASDRSVMFPFSEGTPTYHISQHLV